MNDRDWIQSRRPSAPAKLFDRLELAVGSDAQTIARSETLSAAAAAILAPLVASVAAEAARDRKTAIDLLAADALVTYAIEAAAEDCDAIAQNLDRVILQLASLAAAGKA